MKLPFHSTDIIVTHTAKKYKDYFYSRQLTQKMTSRFDRNSTLFVLRAASTR
jgi:hypothetical protein